MKKQLCIFVATLAAPSLQAQSVTLSIEGGVLFDSFANPLPEGDLIIAVSTGLSNEFTGPSVGSFTSGTEQFLGSWFVDFGVLGDDGGFSTGLVVSLTSEILAGQQFGILWFPGLTDSNPANVSVGQTYGFYTDSSWLIPNPPEAVSFGFETDAVGGPLPDSAGSASFSVVPEPSAFAFLAGVVAIGFVAVRRRQRR